MLDSLNHNRAPRAGETETNFSMCVLFIKLHRLRLELPFPVAMPDMTTRQETNQIP